jgi:signal peptidase
LETHDLAGCELIADALRAGHEARIRVTGTSMLPAIWPGDVLLVRPLGDTHFAKGNIVLFLRDGRLFAHRVVDRSGDRLITRGDAVPDCDPPVSASELLGVVAGIVRHDGSMRVVPSAPPMRHRMIAFAVRHSQLAYRMVLKVHQCGGLLRTASAVTGWSGFTRVPRSHQGIAGE